MAANQLRFPELTFILLVPIKIRPKLHISEGLPKYSAWPLQIFLKFFTLGSLL